MSKLFMYLFIFSFVWFFSVLGFSQNANSKLSQQIVHSFIERYPNPDSISWRPGTNQFSWQAGYIMFALEKYWRASNDIVAYNYIKKYVDQQVLCNGDVPDFRSDELDNFLPGYAILFLYEQTKLDKYRNAAIYIKSKLKTYPRTANGIFWHAHRHERQVWVDGVFMAQIFLARYAALIGESNDCYNEIAHQMLTVANLCQKKNGLLLHGWDESRKASWSHPITGLSSEVWSEGLGWYAVLSSEILGSIDTLHFAYSSIKSNHQKMCKGLLRFKNKRSEMWCQIVDKPYSKGNWDESSGTAMFIYCLEKSYRRIIVKNKMYHKTARTAYKALVQKIRYNTHNFVDVYDCSSIGIKGSYSEYIKQPKEISTFAAFGSVILASSIMDYPFFQF